MVHVFSVASVNSYFHVECKLQIEECGLFAHHSLILLKMCKAQTLIIMYTISTLQSPRTTKQCCGTCVVFLEVCDVGKVTVPKSSGYKPNMIVQILKHPFNIFGYLGEQK
jgi:hypothetical protein